KSAPDYEKPADSGGDNVYDVTVTATGAGGQDTQDIAITVTNVLEGSAPTITSGELTRDSTPVITGTATAGSVVTIAVAGATYAVTATDGTWSLDLGAAVPRAGTLALDPNGANSVSVSIAGEEAEVVTQQLTIDTTAPSLAITSITMTSDSIPVITGTAETGAIVTITVESATYSLVATDGAWSLDLGAAVPETGTLTLNLGGANKVSATATDAAGNTATADQTLILDGAAATTTLISGQLTGNSYYRPWTPADIAMVLEGGSADTITVYTGNEISESAPDLYNYATAVFVPILAGSFTFSVSAADIPDASFDFSDVFMAVYEASFDPEDPLNNLIYANDDTSETDFKPTIANIQLQPFTHYIVVLTAYDPVATGTYTIAAKGPAGGAWMGADTGESLVIISDPSAVFAENDTGPVYTAEVSA
ncbi:hypothetical protein, partial [Skermanella aerolata]|uniref:hypothetical protein n=1 Tax=Skermanella aerolata TaxID=393310 RepID=UPI0005C8933A